MSSEYSPSDIRSAALLISFATLRSLCLAAMARIIEKTKSAESRDALNPYFT